MFRNERSTMDSLSMTSGGLRWSTRTKRPVHRFAEEQVQNEDTIKVEESEKNNLTKTTVMSPALPRESSSPFNSSTNSFTNSSSPLSKTIASLKVASAERAKWLVDNLDEAPDNQNLKPKLRRPNFQRSKDANLLVRFVEGGPCYICKATKSCDIWHSNLYMKRPVTKASAVTADGFNRMEKESYEWYCSECFQLDYLRRKVSGGPCDVCGKHETIDRFETHMFNRHDEERRRICSSCYEKDYNRRAALLHAKHKKMHDEWNGQQVFYGANMRGDSVDREVDVDNFDFPAVDGRRGGGKKADGREKWPRKPRQPARECEEDTSTFAESTPTEAKDDADATINDETLIDPDVSRVSLGSRRQGRRQSRGLVEDTAYSSGPDDESHSPRLTLRRSSARSVPTPAPPRTWAQPSGRFSFEAALATANDPDLTLEDYLSRESSVVSLGRPGDRAPAAAPNVVLPVRERAQTPIQARLEAARRPAPATMVGGRRRGTSRRPSERRE